MYLITITGQQLSLILPSSMKPVEDNKKQRPEKKSGVVPQVTHTTPSLTRNKLPKPPEYRKPQGGKALK